MDKVKELELDIQYLKDAYNRSVLMYTNIVAKLKKNRQIINARKDFIFSQFRIIFDNGKF